MKVLLASPRLDALQALTEGLAARDQVTLETVDSGEKALGLIKPGAYDLAVLDDQLSDPPLDRLLAGVLGADAFINMAVISELPEEEFHEVYEGFGLLAGLSPAAGRAELDDLLARLAAVRAGLPGASA